VDPTNFDEEEDDMLLWDTPGDKVSIPSCTSPGTDANKDAGAVTMNSGICRHPQPKTEVPTATLGRQLRTATSLTQSQPALAQPRKSQRFVEVFVVWPKSH